LIVRMVRENPTWGEERVAAELSVKLGILVSARTVRAYWPQDTDPRGGRRISSQHWRSFVRNHAKAMVAADFLVAITAGFRVLYVLVVMEVSSRRILHCNVTAHPTAAWTLQQFREAVPGDHSGMSCLQPAGSGHAPAPQLTAFHGCRQCEGTRTQVLAPTALQTSKSGGSSLLRQTECRSHCRTFWNVTYGGGRQEAGEDRTHKA
jgi:hypothetical protein